MLFTLVRSLTHSLSIFHVSTLFLFINKISGGFWLPQLPLSLFFGAVAVVFLVRKTYFFEFIEQRTKFHNYYYVSIVYYTPLYENMQLNNGKFSLSFSAFNVLKISVSWLLLFDNTSSICFPPLTLVYIRIYTLLLCTAHTHTFLTKRQKEITTFQLDNLEYLRNNWICCGSLTSFP